MAWDRYAYVYNSSVNHCDSSGHCFDGLTIAPCLLALIAIVGFSGGAAIYEYNVSGNSWWESPEDALATAQAGIEGAMAALTTAELAVTFVVTGNMAIETVKYKLSNSFKFGTLPTIGGDPDNFTDANYPPGTFSIIDWSGYPDGSVPQPKGPFRLLDGEEYNQARQAANQANRLIHSNDSNLDGFRIHEIHPVKFAGNPIDPSNKIALTPSMHAAYTVWWYRLQKMLEIK